MCCSPDPHPNLATQPHIWHENVTSVTVAWQSSAGIYCVTASSNWFPNQIEAKNRLWSTSTLLNVWCMISRSSSTSEIRLKYCSWKFPTCLLYSSSHRSHHPSASAGMYTRRQLAPEWTTAGGRRILSSEREASSRACSDSAAAWICCQHTGVCPASRHGSMRVSVGGDDPCATTH